MRVDAVGMDGVAGSDGIAHAIGPGGERRIVRERKAAILGTMAVGIDGDVGDGEASAGEERRLAKAAVQGGERAGSGFALAGNHGLVAIEPSGQAPEAQRADDRLDIVLFEEQPLHDLGAPVAVGRQQGRTFREVGEDRVGFGDGAAVFELKDRDRACRVERQESIGMALALENREDAGVVRDLQQAEQDPDFPAILRWQIIVKRKHGGPS